MRLNMSVAAHPLQIVRGNVRIKSGSISPLLWCMDSSKSPRPLSANNSSDVSGQSSSILILDDDEICQLLFTRYLRADPAAQHTVVSAVDIDQALTIFMTQTFDCVLVDYFLPDGTGADAIDQFRKAAGEAMPCTIVLTGQSGEKAAIEAVRAGASDFLTKGSLTKSALCRAVNNSIEKSRLRNMHMRRLKELEIANGLLRRRNDEIQRFYHTVSHEVKTPLTAIQEFVSILHDGLAGEVTDNQKDILQYALQSCDQIKSHFDELLELSRFETGKMKVNLEPTSIYEVFEHCLAAARAAAKEKQIELVLDDAPDLPLVMMQSNRISQVVSNFVNNSLKFTPENGRVTLGACLTHDGERIRLSVSDTGIGIPEADVNHIFERLYQVTPASDRENESGMGLGLSIAAQIVGLHGSRIEVDSIEGEGSTFSFELNTAETHAVEFSQAA